MNMRKISTCLARAAGLSVVALALIAPSWLHAGGTIAGKVTLDGKRPKMKRIKMITEQVCDMYHKDAGHKPRVQEIVCPKEGGPIQYSFVWVKSGLGDQKFKPPKEPVLINQVGCMYEPHVIGVQTKQQVLIKNSDVGVLHNVHAFSEVGNEFNIGMPGVEGAQLKRRFKKQEVMVDLKCDVHGWMQSYIGVVDHPYFAVTGEDGSFTISDLPAGTYEVECWQEALGSQTQTVTVGEGETKEISFTYQPPQ